MSFHRSMLALVAVATSLPASAQFVTTDQVSPVGTAWFTIHTTTLTWQAQVRAGVSGILEGFTIRMGSSTAACSVRAALRWGPGWNTSPALFETIVATPGPGEHDVHVDVSSAGLSVVPGAVFVIELQGTASNVPLSTLVGSYVAPPDAPLYADPVFAGNAGCFSDCGWRIAFQTFVRMDAGAAFCSADGAGTACPCGNDSSAGRGCGNSLGAGAQLTGAGAASVTHDSFVLTVGAVPNSSVLFFQGTTQIGGGAGTVFGDGLRCAGGTVTRLGASTAAGNSAFHPRPGDAPISVQGAIPPAGAVRTYQAWYRNAADFCTSATFNLSNGWGVVWAP